MDDVKHIGRYALEASLGGGMATVYRAHDTVMGRTVAVKVLKEMDDGGQARERFLQEAKVAALLTHENVVRIYDYGEDEQNRPYMVMEYVPGQDLAKAIKTGLPGDLRRKLEIALAIGRALEYIHSNGIVHRDVKPENICLTANGGVKLMDFGIAKLGSISMTRTGFTVGTPPYMSPEQVRAQNVTRATDIYAFGLVLYEIITGRRAFQADQYELVFYKVLNEPVDERPLRDAGAGSAICGLIRACTAKDAARRPQSFGEVCQALEGIIGSGEGATLLKPVPAGALSQDSAATRTLTRVLSFASDRRRMILAVCALAVILLSVLAVVSRWTGKAGGSRATVEKRTLPPSIQTSTGEMVLVPAGEFLFGEHKERVTLPDVYIDKTEVSNAAYANFLSDRGRPSHPDLDSKPDYPVVNVTFADAQAFASWAGKRLPTMREWEKAVRGIDGRLYPWGSEPDPTRANVAPHRTRVPRPRLFPVVSFERGASPWGALNLVGNVWEFVDETAQASPEDLKRFQRLPSISAEKKWVRIRGGSSAEPLDATVAWNSIVWPAGLGADTIGFRCAMNPPAR